MKNIPTSTENNLPVSTKKKQNAGTIKADFSKSALERQMKQEGMCEFMQPLTPLLMELDKTLLKRPVFDKIVDENAKHGFKGRYPKLRIDFPHLILSQGSLPNPDDLSVSSPKPGKLVFRWTDNSGILSSLPTDLLFIGVFNDNPFSWMTSIHAAYRSAGCYTLNATDFRRKRVVVYAGFISEDIERMSTSLYLGELKVA